MEKLLSIIFLISIPLGIPAFASSGKDSITSPVKISEILPVAQPINTTSRFEVKEEQVVDKIAKQTIFQNDPSREIGEEAVLAEGKDGQKTTFYKVTYFEGKEYEREKIKTDLINPQNKMIARGTKIVWRTIDTPSGPIRYWRKIRVWATHYDSHCPGCNQTTAIGLKQGKGVIAVDPSVIKLRSQVYIPGYGTAIAGDTGGAIKGNVIDLGFDDAKTAGWYAHYVDIYLIN